VTVEPQPRGGDDELRVIVVDDHALFRRAICDSLETRGFTVSAALELGEDALPAALEHRPHVVLMDQRLPGLSGPEATRLILAEVPDTRVVAISAFSSIADLGAALSAGAAGYMLKSATPDELAAAVRAAAAGDTPLSPAAANHLVAHFRRTTPSEPRAAAAVLIEQLSDRQREILGLMVAGHDNGAIAELLVISPHTVKGHVSGILGALGVSNRIQAAVLAARHGLE
jgi:DNA-binding NarL/FixJ family response regulator